MARAPFAGRRSLVARRRWQRLGVSHANYRQPCFSISRPVNYERRRLWLGRRTQPRRIRSPPPLEFNQESSRWPMGRSASHLNNAGTLLIGSGANIREPLSTDGIKRRRGYNNTGIPLLSREAQAGIRTAVANKSTPRIPYPNCITKNFILSIEWITFILSQKLYFFGRHFMNVRGSRWKNKFHLY